MKPPATSVGAAPGPAASGGREPEPGGPPGPDADPAANPARLAEPALPEQSREDTDAAWGDYPEPSDDRLYRDRPPHWADY